MYVLICIESFHMMYDVTYHHISQKFFFKNKSSMYLHVYVMFRNIYILCKCSLNSTVYRLSGYKSIQQKAFQGSWHMYLLQKHLFSCWKTFSFTLDYEIHISLFSSYMSLNLRGFNVFWPTFRWLSKLKDESKLESEM